jgi:hypothetical protein
MTPKMPTPIRKEPKSPDTDALLYGARERVIRAMPNIIDAIIVKAQTDASYLHAKFLLEFASCEPGSAPVSGSEESLAAMLLKELREEPVS